MNPTAEQLRASLQQALDGVQSEVRDGERHYVVRAARGQYPVVMRLRASATSAPKAPGEGLEGRAAGEPPMVGDMVTIKGVASSTSIDWYGTEMSPDCLQSMAQQFAAGVGIYPSHGGGMFGPGLGWDDEMGSTTSAEMERANVATPADATEPGWVLNVTMDLDATDATVQSLVKRLGRSQPIGLSIGGWFTEVRYITDDKGELKRIIVESVELDHLAIVRSPANPDCQGLSVLRDAGRESMLSRRSVDDLHAVPAATPAEPTEPTTEPRAVVVVVAVTDDEGAEAVEPQCPECGADPCSCEPEADTKLATADQPETRDAPGPVAPAACNPMGVSTVQVLDTDSADSETQRAAPVPGPTPTHEDAMTPDELRAAVAAALAPTNDRLAALEARGAPAPAHVDTPEELRARVAALEAANARQRTVIGNLTSQPQRMAGGARSSIAASGSSSYAGSEIGQLIKRCEAMGDGHAPAVREVVIRHQPMLAVKFRSRGAEGAKLRDACEQAPDLLRELLCAADDDGTLREWHRAQA